MKYLNEKLKLIKEKMNKIDKNNLVNIELDLDIDTLQLLTQVSINTGFDVNTIVLTFLQETINKFKKKEIKFDGLIMNNFDYLDYLNLKEKTKEEFKETILIYNWIDPKTQAVSLPIKKYNKLKKLKI